MKQKFKYTIKFIKQVEQFSNGKIWLYKRPDDSTCKIKSKRDNIFSSSLFVRRMYLNILQNIFSKKPDNINFPVNLIN